MKFTFICIVIAISCSVCACNDLDIYSGLNFDFNKPRGVSRLSDYDRPSYYPKLNYPLENITPDDYDDPKLRETSEYDSIPDKIRQFQEVIDWERTQLHKHRPHHEFPALAYYLEKLNKPERFDLEIPPLHRLDESRINTPDYDLGFSEKTGNYRKIFEVPAIENGYENTERLTANDFSSERNEHSSGSHHALHPNDKDANEFTTNRFNNVKVVENPSEFAYVPSDPRFYRKTDGQRETTFETTTQKEKTTITKVNLETQKLLVSARSDQGLTTGSRVVHEEVNHKDTSIEMIPIQPNLTDVDSTGVYIIAIVAGISAAATVGLIAVGIGWYNLQKHVKNATDVEYPAYGVTGPNKDISPSGDRRLAQSAQMYHYQHQKQQIIAMERAPPGEQHGSVSEAESDEENEEGDYTVYECPGLAPTGEMEVKNPLFQDDITPAQTPATKPSDEEKK